MKDIPTGAQTPRPGQFARRTLQPQMKAPPSGRLRISKLSGDLLVETDARQQCNVKDLLTFLEPHCNVPKQRIRLLHAGRTLRSGRLRSGTVADMQAIILPYVEMLDGSEQAEDFRNALWTRDATRLEKLLWRPIDPNTIFRKGYLAPVSALEMLFLNQEAVWPTAALRLLLQARAGLDRLENRDVLTLAVKYGEVGYAQTLLEHRAHLDGSADPWTPLDVACQNHAEDLSSGTPRPGLITMLLTARADPSPMLQDASSWAPRQAPIDHFRLTSPRILSDTVALACAAAAHPDPSCMQRLVEAAHATTSPRDPGCSKELSKTYVVSASLCSAAYIGNTRNVRWLLEMRAPADAQVCEDILEGKTYLLRSTRKGRTALSLAAGNGHWETMQTLLTAKANPSLSFDGHPPLHLAARLDAPTAMLKSLLKAAAEANQEDGWGRTALAVALQTFRQPSPAIRILLQAKAEAFRKDGSSTKPLQILAEGPSLKLTKPVQERRQEEAPGRTPASPRRRQTMRRESPSHESDDAESMAST